MPEFIETIVNMYGSPDVYRSCTDDTICKYCDTFYPMIYQKENDIGLISIIFCPKCALDDEEFQSKENPERAVYNLCTKFSSFSEQENFIVLAWNAHMRIKED